MPGNSVLSGLIVLSRLHGLHYRLLVGLFISYIHRPVSQLLAPGMTRRIARWSGLIKLTGRR